MRMWGGVLGVVLAGLASAGVRAADRAVVATTDFGSGSLAVVDLETYEAATNLLNIHSDAVVRAYSGKVYVVNRQGQDNILVLDPDDPGNPVLQFSTGNGSNPQDIAFVSDTKAYVARLASDRVLVVNPATGDSLGSIDLSFAADADGLPEAAHLAIFDGRLYVTCQRLDQNSLQPTDRSEVVVVDTDTDTVIDQDAEQAGLQGIVLQATNPFAGQVQVGAKLYLSCAGSVNDMADGGIEVVDLQNNRTDGVVMGESDLGGNIGALAMVSENRGYVVVSDASFLSSVKAFDLVNRQVGATLPQVSGKSIPDIGVLNGRLSVLDRGTWTTPEANFWIYDTSADTLLAGPISTGLPPNSIAFIGDGQAETGEPGAEAPSTELPTGPAGPIALDLNLDAGDQEQRQSTSVPKVGDQVTIDVVGISGVLGNGGFQVKLQYDPAQLEWVGFQGKDIFVAGMAILPPPAGGVVEISVAILAGQASKDSGSLGHATFKVLDGFTGETRVELISASYNESVTVGPGGSVVVLGGETSVPADPVARSDFSGDGEVGFDDFLLFAQNFGKQSVDPDFNVRVDLDDDGTVGFSDFLLFAGNFGKVVGG